MRLRAFLFAVPILLLADLTAEAADGLKLRGKYLIVIGGCNDCHTSGYAPSGGATPKPDLVYRVV
jgi:mono/diheme cytochrome c family protein